MTRLFGIAGVQMSVERWNAHATIDKMSDLALNISKSFPWVNLVMFHELVVPGLVQFVTPEDKDWYLKNSEAIPGPLTEGFQAQARKTHKWLVPGSMWELDGDKMYNTAIVISPEGEIVAKYPRQGSGELIRPLTADSLTAAVGRVLSAPSYRDAARRAGTSGADVADPVVLCHAALGGRAEQVGAVRLTEFTLLVEEQFGAARGAALVADHGLAALGGRTPAQAIEAGVEPRDVWRALCEDFDVPRDQW